MKNLLHAVVLSLFLSGCGDDDLYKASIPILEEGVLGVQVIDIDGVEVDRAHVSIFDDNNVFVESAFTDSIGERSFELQEGVYTIKVNAQGYIPSPVPGGVAIAVQINGGEATDRSISIANDPNTLNTTYIQGNANIRGNLIAISNDLNAYSTFTDSNGDYYLYNIPAGNYKLTSYHAGYETDNHDVSVVADTPILDKKVNARQTSNLPKLTGSVKFLSSSSIPVDITVILPETGDVIPGAMSYTRNDNYTIDLLPKGSFKVWATNNNDGYVIDPDSIVKKGGEEEALGITVDSSDIVKTFDITRAVPLISPTNAIDQVMPEIITTLTPTFEWTTNSASSSAGQFAIEVTNADGEVMWGGVDVVYPEGVTDPEQAKLVPIHGWRGKATKETYSFDGNGKPLEDGQLYRWSVTAIDSEASGTARSMSETQMGLFKVQLPK